MSVLRAIADHGLPDDYFFARVRARRAALSWAEQIRVQGKDETGSSARQEADAWHLLQEELLWNYRQMNARLRQIFQAFFIFMELKNLFCCLRYHAAAMPERIEEILRFSLLAKELRSTLAESAEVAMAINRIASSFGPGFFAVTWQQGAAERDKIKHFETALSGLFLQQAVDAGLHAELTLFFRMQIDLRNVMLVAKHRRWAIAKPPLLLPGGLVARKKLAAASWQEVFSGTWASGLQLSSDPRLEGALIKKISVILTRRSRSGYGVSLVLDYLWQLYLAARNGSLLNRAGALPSELLNEELIQ